jgi:hypothetical protein
LHKLALDDEDAGGFVHGSLCPRNFMLTERGDVKVMGLIGVRPVGRVVGREHVPAAAMAYASPDLLGGAPVTPAVDVHSLGAVLQELLGDGSGIPEGEKDELGGIVRELLRRGPSAGFSTVETFAAALQDAVRRTGTVVARQSIAAQVRGVCEQYLLERRRQVRTLRDFEWADQKKDTAGARFAAVGAAAPMAVDAVSAPSPDELEEMEAAAEDGVDLGEYEEDAGDDAVTRIYDGDDVESEASAQPQAWMHDSRPADATKAGLSRWAVLTLLGVVLVAVASGAAVMASRSVARASRPVAVAGEEAKLAAAMASEPSTAAASVRGQEATARGDEEAAAVPSSAAGALAAVRGQRNVEEVTGTGSVPAREAAADSDDGDKAEGGARGRARKARRAAVLRRAAAVPRRGQGAATTSASAKVTAPASAPAEEAEEPETVDVLDLPEAKEEAPPVAEAPKPAAAPGDGDLVIEEGAPKMAFLSVDASPYATVFIDGEKKGMTPLVRLELSPGLHRMVARTEDGRTKRFTLQLEPGKTEAVRVSWEE